MSPDAPRCPPDAPHVALMHPNAPPKGEMAHFGFIVKTHLYHIDIRHTLQNLILLT